MGDPVGTIVVPPINAVLIAHGIQQWVLSPFDVPGITGLETVVYGDGTTRHGDKVGQYTALETAHDYGPDHRTDSRFMRHGYGDIAVYDGRRTATGPAPWPIKQYALPYATATITEVLPVVHAWHPVHRLNGGRAVMVYVYDHTKPDGFGLGIVHSDNYSGRDDERIYDQNPYCDWRGTKRSSDHVVCWAWRLTNPVPIIEETDDDDG